MLLPPTPAQRTNPGEKARGRGRGRIGICLYSKARAALGTHCVCSLSSFLLGVYALLSSPSHEWGCSNTRTELSDPKIPRESELVQLGSHAHAWANRCGRGVAPEDCPVN